MPEKDSGFSFQKQDNDFITELFPSQTYEKPQKNKGYDKKKRPIIHKSGETGYVRIKRSDKTSSNDSNIDSKAKKFGTQKEDKLKQLLEKKEADIAILKNELNKHYTGKNLIFISFNIILFNIMSHLIWKITDFRILNPYFNLLILIGALIFLIIGVCRKNEFQSD